jgi:NAD(P)H dehydrogenase (quinone)
MIVVTGATGQLGRAIVHQLLQRRPASQVAVSVRDPDKAAGLAALGVRVRRGDFGKPETLAGSFEGAQQVLLVSSNAAASGGDPLAQHRAAIEAARAAGVSRIVYTSHVAASASSAFPPMRDHHATEEMLRASALAWTSLRNGFYASSGLAMMGDVGGSGLVAAPADGKVSWTTHADLAEAAAVVLTNEGRFEGPTPPLTAGDALDFGELAALASEILRKPVRREILTDEELASRMASRNVPPSVVQIALGFYLASRAGEFRAADPTLEALLGRAPVGMRVWLAAKLAPQPAS